LKKIIHIVGNRPQFIKLAVLYKALQQTGVFEQSILHTGQHFSYEMDALFFEQLHIPAPDHNFHIQHSSPNQFIGLASDAIQEQLVSKTDAAVLLYGDTNSTLAGALAAQRTNTPIIHFEAGVRTGNKSMPEEINRVLTDRLAAVNYCCTQQNLAQLKAEGYGKSIACEALFTGDLMLDAFLQIDAATAPTQLPQTYILCTIHRAANLEDPIKLGNIIKALNEIHDSIPVVMPMHPHTQKKITAFGLTPRFIQLPAVGYPQMKQLMMEAQLLITDSGGASREAYFMKKLSVIVMDHPFWPEIIEAGCSLRADADSDIIKAVVQSTALLQPNFDAAIFGDGSAAKKIATHLVNYL
jgi:UDP-GlcNAc3NAcA epimerase